MKINGSSAEGSIKSYMWLNDNSKLDYKESYHGQFQATVNWMKIR